MMIITKKEFKGGKIISACHIICGDEILLLLRNEKKPQGNTYGAPAGKADDNETPQEAAIREVKEETGIDVNDGNFEFCKIFNVRYSEYDFEFHLFNLYLEDKPEIVLNDSEHSEYVWVTPSDAIELPLIEDEDNVLKDVFNL